jgi:hypothetical protein
MVLDKLMSILAQMPMKSQKTVMRAIDFSAKPPSEVYQDIIHTMQSVAKSAAQRDILEVYAQMPISDADILAAFGDRAPVKIPLTFDDTQIEYIRDRIYRNRDGKFRLIPMGNNCSADAMPLDGLDADEKIIDAKLSVSRLNEIGGVEKFDGLSKLEEQPYEPPYDGVFKQLAPNLQRINIISSFDTQDPYGFFVRDDKMYRNVCAQMTQVNPAFVTDESLRRAMLLLFLVSGGKASEWEQLYRVIHFMVRCPDSASGIILYLNDFDAGGNGKSKLVSVLQTMFGDTFTAFAPQQLRFTMSLMGKRLVSISEFEGATTDQLQSIMKSMTGRDRFQYEGKGVDPIVADTYQNFIISSNKYIYFEDNGIKRRLQNFHCSNLLHSMLTRYCHNQAYLDKFFGNVFDKSASRIKHEMAHSLLNYILNDNDVQPLNIKPQQIVLGSLKNPVLRALFSAHMNPDAFITEDTDGARIDVYRLSSEAKPEQLNYACSTIQSWFPDVSFNVARDSSSMTCDLPEQVLIRRLQERLQELDETSRRLKSKTGIYLDNTSFKQFNSADLLDEFLGQSFIDYNIAVTKTTDSIIME